MTSALDTNVIVAGLLTWHEHHRSAAAAIEAAIASTSAGLVTGFGVAIVDPRERFPLSQ